MAPVSPNLARHVQDITSGLVTLARSRQGHIAALTVAAEATFLAESGAALKAALVERLRALGSPDVEVVLRVGEGPVRLLSVEYAR